jgi:hypothetical protein
MSVKRRVLAVWVLIVVTAAANVVATQAAGGATQACGPSCISVFSKELGNSAHPGPVEDVLDGVAAVGQPVILKRASSSDASEDTVANLMPVPAFYAAGMVSEGVNEQYEDLSAAQIQYAPNGVRTGLCVGLATTAYENEGLTLQPCGVPAVTVWIIDTDDSRATAAAGYFPLVNASTTDFDHPYAMHLSRNEVVSANQLLQIRVRRLQFLGPERSLPDRQLWGVHRGAFN